MSTGKRSEVIPPSWHGPAAAGIALMLIAPTMLGGCFLFEPKAAGKKTPYYLEGKKKDGGAKRASKRRGRERDRDRGRRRRPPPSPDFPVPDLGPIYRKYRGRVIITQRKIPSSPRRRMLALDRWSVTSLRLGRARVNWYFHFYAALRHPPMDFTDSPGARARKAFLVAFDFTAGPYKFAAEKRLDPKSLEVVDDWSLMKLGDTFRPGRQYQFRVSARRDPDMDYSPRNEIVLAKSAIITLR